jgi:hypothetical protein
MALPDGVPPLLSGINRIAGAVIQLRAIAQIFKDFLFGTQETWGIFFNGKLLIDFDGIQALSYTSTSTIPTHQIEKGSFSSYNKTFQPFTIPLTGIKTGSHEAISQTIFRLDELVRSIQLVTVVTPERVYKDCSVTSFSYTRDSNSGASILKCMVTLTEVIHRAEATSIQVSTKEKQATQTADTGRVEPQ